MAKYYAWSNFVTDKDEWGNVKARLNVGDEVTADKLGGGDEEWQSLIDAGAVRTDKYPDLPSHISPAEAAIAEENEDAGINVSLMEDLPAVPAKSEEPPAPEPEPKPAAASSSSSTTKGT